MQLEAKDPRKPDPETPPIDMPNPTPASPGFNENNHHSKRRPQGDEPGKDR